MQVSCEHCGVEYELDKPQLLEGEHEYPPDVLMAVYQPQEPASDLTEEHGFEIDFANSIWIWTTSLVRTTPTSRKTQHQRVFVLDDSIDEAIDLDIDLDIDLEADPEIEDEPKVEVLDIRL